MLENFKAVKNHTLLLVVLLLALAVRLADLNVPFEASDEHGHYVSAIGYLYSASKLDFGKQSYWQYEPETPPVAKYAYGLVSALNLYFKHPDLKQYLASDPGAKGGKYALVETKDLIPSRLVSVLFSLGTTVFVYLTARKVAGENAGVMAAFVFAFLPHSIAHAKIAGLETPSMFFQAGAVYFFLNELGKKTRNFTNSALMASLAVSTRFNNGAVLIALVLAYAWVLLKEKRHWSEARALWPYLVLPPLVMFLVWPWLWVNPVESFLWSLKHWAAQQQEYFMGELGVVPAHYFITYLVATTPLLAVLLAVLGVHVLGKKDGKALATITAWIAVVVVLQSFFGLFFFAQNGLRYIIGSLPALAVLAGVGGASFLDLLGRQWKKPALALAAFYLISSSVNVHPYYLDYYNELVGGPGGVYASKSLNINWWSEGNGEAMRWLNENAPENAKVDLFLAPCFRPAGPIRNDLDWRLERPGGEAWAQGTQPGYPLVLEEDLPRKDADFVLVTTYYNWYSRDLAAGLEGEFDEAFKVEVQGARLATVYSRKGA